MAYLKFLKSKIYVGVLIVCGFAMIGSVLGARKESYENITVYGCEKTGKSIVGEEQDNAPELSGYLPLAADQNKWYNFKYAAVFAGIGVLLYLVSMAIYFRLYTLPIMVKIRKMICIGRDENKLFIRSFEESIGDCCQKEQGK